MCKGRHQPPVRVSEGEKCDMAENSETGETKI